MTTKVKNEKGIQYGQYVDMTIVHCCNCGVPFAMPETLRKRFEDDNKKWFYCPNGHGQHYTENTEYRLQKQLAAEKESRQKEEARLKAIAFSAQENASGWQKQWENQIREKKKAMAKLKRTEKRIANGVCPCCNRTFKDLAAHMKTKHPEEVKK